jgi:DNA-binding NarL/FixJ family response regulator
VSIKWRSVLIHPLVLGFIVSTLAIFVFLKLLPQYKVTIAEKSTIGNNGHVYFSDLNADGINEKINYYEYDNLFPPTLYLYDNEGSFTSLFAFMDLPIKNLLPVFCDYNNDKSTEIFILNHNNDSLFLYVASYINKKEFILSRQFLSKLPKEFTILNPKVIDINSDNKKDLIVAIRSEKPPYKSEVIAFSIDDKQVLYKTELKLYATDLQIADGNNDGIPELYLSNKAIGNNGNGVLSGLIVLDHTLNYLFNPVQFVSKLSEVKISLIKAKNITHIAVLNAGKTNQKTFSNLILFDFFGKKIKERALDTLENYDFIPFREIQEQAQILSENSIIIINDDLKAIKKINLGKTKYECIANKDFNKNGKDDLVLKSENEVLFIIDNFNEKLKLSISGNEIPVFTIKNNIDKNAQLSLQIATEWYLIDVLNNKSHMRNYLFYFIAYIVLTFIVYSIMRFIFRRKKKNRITKFIESEEDQYKIINELEDKLGNKIARLRTKINSIKGNNGEEYENVIDQIDDTYSQLKTISEKISRENTRGIYIHDFFNHLSETFTANKVKINLYPNDEWFEISTDLQNHLYKLFDDTLNHICDFIKNTTITISLTRHLNHINCLVDIENEYIDILSQKSEKLNAIISRMLLLNGKYETDGSKGNGTLINYTIPLNSSFTYKKTDKKIRVIIAEDHDVSLFGLITLFKTKEDIEIIGTAKNGLEVLKILEEKSTEIVITDISMPGMDGIELSEKLKNDYPDIKVIVFTMYMENWFVEQLTKNGAHGFVSKNSRINELVEAVRQVSKGGYFYCHQFKSKFGMNGVNGYDSQKSMLDSLTTKELQIVEFIANDLKRKEIAVKLNIHQSTIDTYLANIMLKLNAGDEDEVARIAKKQKFVTDIE